MNDFKKIFLSLRNSKGFNQEQMAKELGLSKSTIAMWETGNRLPSPDVIEQIADYFNVDIDFLYGRTNIKRKIYYDEYGDEYVNMQTPPIILKYYSQLNDNGKQEATKRVKELTYLPEYSTEHEHLMLDAAREIKNSSKDDKKHDEDIMNDKNF